jgi:uncharacterized small protein (DUF1192 family)
MYTNEITKALATLAELMQTQEDTYIENGGEITEETEAREEDINALKVLLTTEGADELGRRIAAKQDEVDRYKAEVKAAQVRVKAAQRSVDYYKYLIGQVLRMTDTQAVKGSFYGFQQAVSTKNAVNYYTIEDRFGTLVQNALGHILPGWLHVDFSTTVKELQEAGEADYLATTTTDTITFSKPRKAKED